MVAMSTIEAFVERLVEKYEPEKVIIFGSYAWGNATEDSDVDLLVVMPCDMPSSRKAAEIRSALRPGFPLDLLVRSPEQVTERISLNDFFVRDIVEKGNVLYDAAYA